VTSARSWRCHSGFADHLQRNCRLLSRDSDCALYEI
jgi:hypothetical protein